MQFLTSVKQTGQDSNLCMSDLEDFHSDSPYGYVDTYTIVLYIQIPTHLHYIYQNIAKEVSILA